MLRCEEGQMELMVEMGTTTSAGVEAPSQRPVDLVHLSRYTLGNRALEREILELFRTQSGIYLRRLESAETDKAWSDAAHTIKGSARGIGAWGIAAAAEVAEGLTGEDRLEKRTSLLLALSAEIKQTNSFIAKVLADL